MRKQILRKIAETDAKVHVIHTPKSSMVKSPGKEYEIATKEILKRTMSDDKVRGNPKGAKIIIDDSEYASKFDVKGTMENAAKDRGMALDRDSSIRKSHECKPLQINDFPTGAYGARYIAGDRRFSEIIGSKSTTGTVNRNRR